MNGGPPERRRWPSNVSNGKRWEVVLVGAGSVKHQLTLSSDCKEHERFS